VGSDTGGTVAAGRVTDAQDAVLVDYPDSPIDPPATNQISHIFRVFATFYTVNSSEPETFLREPNWRSKKCGFQTWFSRVTNRGGRRQVRMPPEE
jgi:hypothetical protein